MNRELLLPASTLLPESICTYDPASEKEDSIGAYEKQVDRPPAGLSSAMPLELLDGEHELCGALTEENAAVVKIIVTEGEQF